MKESTPKTVAISRSDLESTLVWMEMHDCYEDVYFDCETGVAVRTTRDLFRLFATAIAANDRHKGPCLRSGTAPGPYLLDLVVLGGSHK